MANKKQVSLQAIEDYYYQKGLRGDKLRKATENDKEFIQALKERRLKLTKALSIKSKDRKKYILSTDDDYEILGKIYKLEKKNLSKEDNELLKLARTQLEHDWRVTINEFLDKLLKKYEIY